MRPNKSISDPKISVLFMQSQTFFGADSRIHALLMEQLSKTAEVHAALNYGETEQKPAPAAAIERIAGVHIRPTHFGASLFEVSKKERLVMGMRLGLPAVISLLGLWKYIRKHQIQIIHCTEKPRDAFFGAVLAKLSGAKCIIHLHVKAEGWLDRKVQWAMRKADAVVGVSAFVAGSINAMGFPAVKTHFVHNSLVVSEWDPDTDGTAIRQEFGVDPSTPLLLTASRLFSWKGHTELLKALAVVKKAGCDFKLLIVGDDDPRAHPTRSSFSAELKILAQDLGLQENVIFSGHRTDMPQIMAACDIFTMPSFEEPFGMVFVEAMAMKKPVVALDNGGSQEVIRHGETGLLSAPYDIDQLAANIRALIENRDLRIHMGECGRRRVEECFNPRKMSADMLEIYQHVLSDKKSMRASTP
jgi:glycosyltransferase involved in cell wall biosynthesis